MTHDEQRALRAAPLQARHERPRVRGPTRRSAPRSLPWASRALMCSAALLSFPRRVAGVDGGRGRRGSAALPPAPSRNRDRRPPAPAGAFTSRGLRRHPPTGWPGGTPREPEPGSSASLRLPGRSCVPAGALRRRPRRRHSSKMSRPCAKSVFSMVSGGWKRANQEMFVVDVVEAAAHPRDRRCAPSTRSRARARLAVLDELDRQPQPPCRALHR